uniref:NADH-ubiquinone oxidoreductase chain 6 n=1 Tax=Shelfordella lateralis TaxID=36981 RepID=A0A2P1H8E4_SHELA|nr:NADH dehydrogenase subunit 6 [Periplaneta lateralis]UEV86532.1 NADH dehydrogenase subunit 6 [Periplaneta lateralis]
MMIIMLTTSMIFTQMSHPLAMGLMLLIQTIIVCMMSGLLSQSFWFPYILFLIFLGGMLVLFIYVTSLASNEMFYLSTKMMTIVIIIIPMLLLINNIELMTNNMEIMIHKDMYITQNEIMNSLMKLYNQPTSMIVIMLASYLFLTLIVVVKITNISKGPLRQMN